MTEGIQDPRYNQGECNNTQLNWRHTLVLQHL